MQEQLTYPYCNVFTLSLPSTGRDRHSLGTGFAYKHSQCERASPRALRSTLRYDTLQYVPLLEPRTCCRSWELQVRVNVERISVCLSSRLTTRPSRPRSKRTSCACPFRDDETRKFPRWSREKPEPNRRASTATLPLFQLTLFLTADNYQQPSPALAAVCSVLQDISSVSLTLESMGPASSITPLTFCLVKMRNSKR